ncbi:MAG TPA: shikimate dehydrogenase [Actinomycetes bacterium]|jgi:shikimate dehydrogenase
MTRRRRAAVLGSPIGHSLSPVLHRAAYATLGLDWSYEAIEIDEARLAGFLDGLDESWAGLSLTMPLKRTVIPLLHGLSATAAAVDAVNTVLLPGHGRRIGDNTDVAGMVAALRVVPAGQVPVERVAILGAGATAAAALAALARLGVRGADVFVRSDHRAAGIRTAADRVGIVARPRSWAEATSALAADLLISTVPSGATDVLAGQLRERQPEKKAERAGSRQGAGQTERPPAHAKPAMPGAGVLFDIVYDPWPTRLAAAWMAGGGTVVGGLDLLVEQAALQVELMTGCRPAPVGVMRAAGEAALSARQ